MIIAALVLLGVTAVLPLILAAAPIGHRTGPNLIAAVATPLALGGVAVLALVADRASGAAAVITHCLTVLAAVTGGTLLVRGALLLGGIEPWQLDTRPPEPEAAGSGDAPEPAPTPLRGGRVIGYLERIAVVAALGLRWPEAIAIVLAVKGLGRYPELREPGAAEQFIIGTLASVLWAAAVAGTGYLLLH
ncbi:MULTISPECIES: hypothetical protein [Actinomycetes]|uniref:hypothetical protein n=1 Tax=Actinomycetes TaxID=1760 RepID=UPI0004C1387A|nr:MULTISPECIES: hypothetical protein [Actinomycetes]